MMRAPGGARWVPWSCAALLLAACTTQSPEATDQSVDVGATATASAPASAGGPSAAAPSPRLRPLSRELADPVGSAPRSLVPRVNYELTAIDPVELPPDDGPAGDAGATIAEIFERGGASWYGIQFHQRKTASGERFDMGAFTAAHKTLPFGTRLCVRSLVNGREVLVRVNDRGPFTQGRVIDLSRAAAEQIGLTTTGIKQVALSLIDRRGSRCGGMAAEATEARSVDDAPVGAIGTGTATGITTAAPDRRTAAARRRR